MENGKVTSQTSIFIVATYRLLRIHKCKIYGRCLHRDACTTQELEPSAGLVTCKRIIQVSWREVMSPEAPK